MSYQCDYNPPPYMEVTVYPASNPFAWSLKLGKKVYRHSRRDWDTMKKRGDFRYAIRHDDKKTSTLPGKSKWQDSLNTSLCKAIDLRAVTTMTPEQIKDRQKIFDDGRVWHGTERAQVSQ